MNQTELDSDNLTRSKRPLTVLSWFLSKPAKIVFGFVLCYFLVELILTIRLQLENEFVTVAGWNPLNAVTRPSLLLIASVCLLIDRPSSFVVAALLAISIIYPNLYLAFMGIAHAHGIGPFSVSAVSIWFETIGTRQIVNTVVALLIMTLSAAKIIAWFRRRLQVSASGVA